MNGKKNEEKKNEEKKNEEKKNEEKKNETRTIGPLRGPIIARTRFG